jgi:4-amino-4-deoxy-L-arabinose transferase-like glycosyltransferase
VALICGPWAMAITATTDGGFWTGAVGGDIAPKLAGGHETHGAPPGLHALLLPLLIFPSTFLLPAALIAGWRGRTQPGVRFALAWLIPTWIVFELLPTKLVHYTLPTYGALGWLGAAALADPAKLAFGPRARWIGAGLSLFVGLLFAAASGVLLTRYGDGAGAPWALVAAILAIGAGLAGAWALLKRQVESGLIVCLALGIATHMVIVGGLAPRLNALWTSKRVAARLAQDHLDPRNGVTTGPVVVTGYAEPSLVFALGAGTELDDPADAADSVGDGQPAIVEKKQDKAFRAALLAQKVAARPVDEIKGFDYSIGKPVDLTIWRSLAPQPAPDRAP